MTLDERIKSDTHPDARAILTSGDRFLARVKGQIVAERHMLADDRYDEVTLELRALARSKTGEYSAPTQVEKFGEARSD